VERQKARKLMVSGGMLLGFLLFLMGSIPATQPGREWMLYQAAQRRNFPMVRWCIEHGVNPNIHCLGETNPILLAMDDRQMLHYLHTHGGNMNIEEIHDDWSGSALTHAVMAEDLPAVRNLLAEGADPSSEDVMWWAVDLKEPNHTEIITLLKQAGAHEPLSATLTSLRRSHGE